MRLLDNMTLRVSWSLVLLSFLLLLFVLSSTGLYAVNHSQQSIEQLTNVNVNQQSTLNRTNSTLQDTRLSMARLYEELIEPQTSLTTEERQQRASDLHSSLNNARDVFTVFLSLPANAAHNTLIAPIAASFDSMLDEHLLLQVAALQQGDVATYRQQRDAAYQAYATFYQDAVGFFHHVEEEGNELLSNFDSVISISTITIITVFLIALIVSLVVYWGVGANLIRPMHRITEHFQSMAKGDLSREVEIRGRNEIGVLFAALRHMQQSLLGTVTTVRDSSSEVLTSAQEIAKGNQDLAARTERQSASLTETASSIEEMTSTMERNSDNAAQARQVARAAEDSAQQGGSVVTNVISHMHNIRESSRKITDIIELIDSIAFQTNILALNASVEAARAGEHGRGFAVVASEVRQLATRSANASTDIRKLIETSVNMVEAGTQQADQAGETMAEIMASVKQVTTLMNEIAVATEEQRAGIREVNIATNDMEQTTQQNAAMVEQASTAAIQLQHEAERLTAIVARFKLNESPLLIAQTSTV
ncbi:methyl-accepting chemotaxis protein [Vreelandella nigrificans]|uniref:Methyl-accepting chemotaxis protein n=1 Tax=Vreelandella nigrificans TaxID=2042704 RepID=A0A2A4HH53_9GAMM|nr:methyl-accepting chemotaxis protein [Halomonas nigrificans]PCF94718.1 methyl-accepting chemotaxis protein [Halomonas nigrificans]